MLLNLTLLNAAVGGPGNLDNGWRLILIHIATTQATRAFHKVDMLAYLSQDL